MDYSQYDAADFATDDSFIRWVTTPDPETDRFWQLFLTNNPTQADTLAMARQLVQHLQKAEQIQPAEATVQHIWQRLESGIDQPTPIRRLGSRWWPYAAAASVLLALGFGLWLFNAPDDTQLGQHTPAVFDQPLPGNMTEVSTTDQSISVPLPDGSIIQLATNSSLRYPITFDKAKRDVYLTGEAFFDVARRPEQPFFVHTDALVTKVLGTSFRVQAYQTDRTVTVDVRTGRVSVYSETAGSNKANPQSLVLIPNQKAVYVRADERLTKTITEKPVPVAALPSSTGLSFDDAPVADVLTALERTYGIVIAYDTKTLANCTITTNLTTESLFDKLKIVCKAIGATYHEDGGQIVVEGPGCR